MSGPNLSLVTTVVRDIERSRAATGPVPDNNVREAQAAATATTAVHGPAPDATTVTHTVATHSLSAREDSQNAQVDALRRLRAAQAPAPLPPNRLEDSKAVVRLLSSTHIADIAPIAEVQRLRLPSLREHPLQDSLLTYEPTSSSSELHGNLPSMMRDGLIVDCQKLPLPPALQHQWPTFADMIRQSLEQIAQRSGGHINTDAVDLSHVPCCVSVVSYPSDGRLLSASLNPMLQLPMYHYYTHMYLAVIGLTSDAQWYGRGCWKINTPQPGQEPSKIPLTVQMLDPRTNKKEMRGIRFEGLDPAIAAVLAEHPDEVQNIMKNCAFIAIVPLTKPSAEAPIEEIPCRGGTLRVMAFRGGAPAGAGSEARDAMVFRGAASAGAACETRDAIATKGDAILTHTAAGEFGQRVARQPYILALKACPHIPNGQPSQDQAQALARAMDLALDTLHTAYLPSFAAPQ